MTIFGNSEVSESLSVKGLIKLFVKSFAILSILGAIFIYLKLESYFVLTLFFFTRITLVLVVVHHLTPTRF